MCVWRFASGALPIVYSAPSVDYNKLCTSSAVTALIRVKHQNAALGLTSNNVLSGDLLQHGLHPYAPIFSARCTSSNKHVQSLH